MSKVRRPDPGIPLGPYLDAAEHPAFHDEMRRLKYEEAERGKGDVGFSIAARAHNQPCIAIRRQFEDEAAQPPNAKTRPGSTSATRHPMSRPNRPPR